MPGLEEPKEEVLSGGDIQISRILLNIRVANRRPRNPKPMRSEAGVDEQLDYSGGDNRRAHGERFDIRNPPTTKVRDTGTHTFDRHGL